MGSYFIKENIKSEKTNNLIPIPLMINQSVSLMKHLLK